MDGGMDICDKVVFWGQMNGTKRKEKYKKGVYTLERRKDVLAGG